MATVKNFLSLIKFSHTVFALPFALIGFFLGMKTEHLSTDWMLFFKVILCMVFARTSAMAFNRYIDRDIDAQNERTRMREIPAGIVSSNAALALVVLSSLFFIGTTYFINPLCFYLSPVALLVILGYSFTKRFTWLCHFILGLGLSLAPIGAYLAVTGRFDVIPVLFSFIVLSWVGGFDIIYALQDDAFDRSKNLFSIPAWLGRGKALMVSRLAHLTSLLLIIIIGIYSHWGITYWAGATLFMLLLIYQHSLVKPNDLSRVNLAFATTNGLASIVFATFVIIGLW